MAVSEAVTAGFREAMTAAGYAVADDAPLVYDVSIRACCYAYHKPLADAGWVNRFMGLVQCDVSLVRKEEVVAQLRVTKRENTPWGIWTPQTRMASEILSRCLSELINETVTSPLLLEAIRREVTEEAAETMGEGCEYETIRLPYGEDAVMNESYTLAAVREYRAKKVRDYEVFQYYAVAFMPFQMGRIVQLYMLDDVEKAKKFYASRKAELKQIGDYLEEGDFWEARVPVK